MTTRDRTDLLLLAAIWGFSFLFMRIAVPEFGAFALAELRLAVAALFLFAILVWRGRVRELSSQAVPLTILGAISAAIPFTLFAYAAYHITAGTAAVANASAPLFGALVAFLWLKDRLTPARIAGLGIGFAGVVVLLWDKISFNGSGTKWALAATLAASLSYGIAVNYTKKLVGSADPGVTASGSLIGASVLLLPLSIAYWPAQNPSLASWASVIALGVICTGLAYILYFRLISSAGPAKAIAVTYLVPVFGMLWGAVFLDESVSVGMIVACGVILFGTALTTGTLRLPTRTVGEAAARAKKAAAAAKAVCEGCVEPPRVRLANFR